MQITWKGQSCFQILISNKKNGDVKVVIDPYDEKIGLRKPQLDANVLLITHDHDDHNNVKIVEGNPFLISGPGEYDVKGVFIQGVYAFHDKSQGKERGRITCYIIEDDDGLKVCHLGDIGQSELTEDQLDAIGDVDVLLIPVGGVSTISSSEASKIIGQIEPRIVIPMHYALPKLEKKFDGVDKFLKTMGVKDLSPQAKLTVKKKDLIEEDTKIVVLEP